MSEASEYQKAIAELYADASHMWAMLNNGTPWSLITYPPSFDTARRLAGDEISTAQSVFDLDGEKCKKCEGRLGSWVECDECGGTGIQEGK